MTEAPAAPEKTEVAAARTEQLYVTYCDRSDSLRNVPGYQVRACSLEDPDLLKFAAEYLAYELPLDMWGTEIKLEATPRRLVRIKGPTGRPLLFHTSHSLVLARGRAGNYFSHVLCRETLTACQALQTWASAEWTTDYPSGASKQLPALDDLPRGGTIGDQALTAFLSGTKPPTDQDLATAVWPHRLGSDPSHRQELLRQVLQGCLVVLQAGETNTRNRLYVLAEPGLTGLLLYGAARLLPPAFIADLTFSTYESVHSLRQCKQAQVIGTFAGSSQKGLESEFYLSRGYAIDTFKGNCSTELQDQRSPVLDEVIDMAVRGDWQGIDELLPLCGSERDPLTALENALRMRSAFRRLRGQHPKPEDLLWLQSIPEGQALLDRHAADVWPLVRDWSLKHDEVRRTFRDLLRKHFGELRTRAARSLAAGANWGPHWTLIKLLLGKHKTAIREHFVAILTSVGEKVQAAPLTPQRLAILREWYEISPQPGELPEIIRQMLVIHQVSELKELQEAGLPKEWLGVALGQAAAHKKTVAVGRELLRAASDSAVTAFLAELKSWPKEEQRRVLELLLAREDAHRLELLNRLLMRNLRLPAEALAELLTAIGAFESDVVDFWLQGDHLLTLLASLVGDPKAEVVWNQFCRFLTRQLLHGLPRLERLLEVLTAAVEKLGEAVPTPCEQAIRDWGVLRQAFTKPVADSHTMLAGACQRRGLNAAQELQEWFRVAVRDKPATDPAVGAFASVFLAFHPPCQQRADYSRVVGDWLQLIHQGVEPNRRADFQVFFLEACVLAEHRLAVGQEYQKLDLLSTEAWATLTRNMHGVPIPVEPVGPDGVVPEAQLVLFAEPVPSVLASLQSTRRLAIALAVMTLIAILEGAILLTIWVSGVADRATPSGLQKAPPQK